MNVTIRWRPTSDRGKRLHSGTSTSLAQFEKIFGGTCGPSDVPTLRALATAAPDPAFWEELADIVELVDDEIAVWGAW